MCDLTSIVGLAGSVIGGIGQIAQASAAAKAAKYNAKVADMNAELSERRAKDAIERGQAEEQRQREAAAQLKGRQVAAMAANGVDIGFGSPLDTINDTAVLAELDALTIRRNTAREAYDYRVDAVNKRAGATLNRMEAKSAMTAGYLGAAGTIMGGFGDAWKQYQASRIGAIA